MHRATGRFWELLEGLPQPVQVVARKNFELLRRDPAHPSLHFKKIGNFWSVRAGLNHRALATESDGEFTWVWIGTHDEYERLIKK